MIQSPQQLFQFLPPYSGSGFGCLYVHHPGVELVVRKRHLQSSGVDTPPQNYLYLGWTSFG